MLKVAIPPPPTGLPRFERLFEKEGWAQSSFHCAIQDRTGFLWFCTADGLLRYDGYSLKAFRYDPARDDSLASNTVYAIMEDRQGWIWVGTMGGGLNKFDPETETFTRYQHDPNNPNFYSPTQFGIHAVPNGFSHSCHAEPHLTVAD